MSDAPALKFVEEPYDDATANGILRQFRERGWALLPDLFERDSVEPFVEQIHAAKRLVGNEWRMPDDHPLYVWAARAPRIRQLLAPSLSHSHEAPPVPSLFRTLWVLQAAGESEHVIPRWHKDYEPECMPGKEYHYPLAVFVTIYFEDQQEGYGPPEIVPGSHWDLSLTPWSGAPQETMLSRKQDGILLDQRTWHRGTPRTVPGSRLLAMYGYYALPLFYTSPLRMPRAQRMEWENARTREDLGFWGGFFMPEAKEKNAPL